MQSIKLVAQPLASHARRLLCVQHICCKEREAGGQCFVAVCEHTDAVRGSC